MTARNPNSWRAYFTVRKVGRYTFYVNRRGKGLKPVSQDFRTQGEARSWIKANWETLMMEELLLDSK